MLTVCHPALKEKKKAQLTYFCRNDDRLAIVLKSVTVSRF